MLATVKVMQPDGEFSNSIVFAAAAMNASLPVMQLLIAHGADPHSAGVLAGAAKSGSLPLVKLLLDQGADAKGAGVLAAAAGGYSTLPMVQLLLAKGANPRAAGVLTAAAQTGPLPVMTLLVRKGANPRAADVLCGAAGSIEEPEAKLEYLLAHGAAPGTPGVLAAAVGQGSLSAAKLLLAKGADPNSKGTEGERPLAMARRRMDSPMVELLQAHGAYD